MPTEAARLNRTRLTLLYPAFYLLSGGLALLVNPSLGLKLMLSNGEYGDVLPRFAGALTLGLGLLVVQVIRKRVEALYLTLVAVRVFFVACYVALYFMSRDPFFLTLGGIVGFGFVLTGVFYALDRERSPSDGGA